MTKKKYPKGKKLGEIRYNQETKRQHYVSNFEIKQEQLEQEEQNESKE